MTITLNTALGSSVIFDRHYGEGPGRLLDPSFTAAANDLPYGGTAAVSDADYLNLYYDPEKDLDRTNTSEQAKQNGTITAMVQAMRDALAVLDVNNLLLIVADDLINPTTINVTPSQFGATANYITGLSPFTQVINASVSPTTTTLIASSEGITVPTSTPTQNTTGTVINTVFDNVRPWSSNNINPNKLFPIFIQSGYNSGTLFNRIRAADLGYTFAGTPYVSYIERQQMSITPNFDTETLNSIALWADGGTASTIGGTLNRATLQVRARATNNPGENAYLTAAEDNTQSNAKANKLTVNSFIVANSYKTDIRTTGRFLNIRIDDAIADTSSGYTSTNTNAWNISGFQLGINKGGAK